MKKISYGQVIFLLFICRIFRTLTYNPFRDTNSVIHMWAIFTAILIQFLLLLPVIYIYDIYPNKSVDECAYSISKYFGMAVSLIYALFYILIAARAIRYFTYFMTEMFPEIKNPYFIAISITLVAIYGAYLGIESLGRSSVIISVIFLIILLIMVITSKVNIEIINLNMAIENPIKDFFSCVVKEIGMNAELTAFAFLLPYIKSDIKRAGALLLALKLFVLEIIVFIYTTLLGDYIKVVPIPIFVVGSYSKTRFIERFDAIYMVEWALCAAVTIGMFLFLSSKGIKRIFVKAKDIGIIFVIAIMCLGFDVLLSFSNKPVDTFFDKWFTPILTVVLTFLFPLIMAIYIITKKKESL